MDTVTHEEIERWVELQPKDVLSRLPDCTESREARHLIDAAAELAHRARERRADR